MRVVSDGLFRLIVGLVMAAMLMVGCSDDNNASSDASAGSAEDGDAAEDDDSDEGATDDADDAADDADDDSSDINGDDEPESDGSDSSDADSGDADSGDADSAEETSTDDDGAETPAEPEAVEATWNLRPGVGILEVTEAEPKEPLTLYDADGTELITVVADEFGQASFQYIPFEPATAEAGPDQEILWGDGTLLQPGSYELRNDSAEPPISSGEFNVLGLDDVAPDTFYSSQQLDGAQLTVLGDLADGASFEDGYGYIETRDGTLLSTMVRFPDPAIYGDGPYPTVIESSGYGVSNPEAEEPGVRIARTLGYATVSVNLRGSGCSGGVFDVFNAAQQADGYDVVEVVASQPWVLHRSPGTVGLSYSGITQLYTGATQPPSLAAIAPHSVITDPWVQQWPGGIYNGGFTRRWLEERDAQAAPNGQNWAAARVEAGDEICAEHQQLRNLNLDFEAFGRALENRPDSASERDLRELATQIEVPTYLTGGFHDEQTGAQFPDLIEPLSGAQPLRVSMWNGRHPDGYSQENINRLYEFLEFYVAKRVPQMNPIVRIGLVGILAETYGLEDLELEGDRWVEEFGDDYEAALAAYEAEDPIRVTYELGAGGNEDGEAQGTMTRTYNQWPPADAEVLDFHLVADGAMVEDGPGDDGSVSFAQDTDGVGENFLAEESGGLLERLWEFDWQRFDDDNSAVFDTEPLSEDIVLNGPALADLWMGADVADGALQVTMSEIRPDGVEYLLQTGWLRLGHRAATFGDEADPGSLRPERSFSADDFAEMPSDGSLVRVPVSIPSIGAPVRAGSILRMTVSSPGRDRAEWTFEDPAPGDAIYTIGFGEETPSRLRLAVSLAGDDVIEELAPCPALRGQACRPAE